MNDPRSEPAALPGWISRDHAVSALLDLLSAAEKPRSDENPHWWSVAHREAFHLALERITSIPVVHARLSTDPLTREES